jgi:AsmA-like C-terminal region
MKKVKFFFKIFFIILLLLIGFVFAAPYIFKGKIISLVKREINKSLDAKVDFKDVDISFFRHFPKVSVGLNNLQVIGIDNFAADTLLSAKRMDATMNIMSFLRGTNMAIYNVYLVSPRINAIVSKDGLANWDIVKPSVEKKDADTTAGKPFNLELDYYSIENGYINYMDAQSNMSFVAENLNHSGTGDFTSDQFVLKTKSAADAVSFNYGAVPYLSNVKSTIDADIKIDNKNNIYSFDGLSVFLNDLQLTGKGVINQLANGYAMDISFKSPSTDFKNILSLITPIYQKEFSKVTATGSAIFEGFVKGVYTDSIMPGYHLAAEVKNGSFKYTDLPKGVQQINFKVLLDNPDGETDNTVVDITNGHLAIDNEPFDFRLLVKKPISNMFVDAAVKGKLDLSQVGNYVKLEKGTIIAGLMNADVSVKGNVKDIESQQYSKFYAGGIVDINNFKYVSPDYPTGVKLNTIHTVFTPTKIDVSKLSGQYMNANFTGGGQINNLLSYLLNGKALSANLTVHADKINLNDWIGVTPTDTVKKSTAAVKPFVVPANLDIVLNTKIDKLLYDKVDIQNLAGSLQITDQTVKLSNVNGRAMDGTIKINGFYSTKESKSKPAISMSYDVSQVDIQKTFFAFNTSQKLMPIGKYLSGKLTSVLSANGKLGDNMDIDMSTISGNGNLFLIEGFLSKFAPLDKIASVLNVKELQSISMKGVKTFFDFSNGKLLIKPFTVKIKNIEMEIGGLQGIGFDEGINYAINIKLPRALMGTQGNQFVDKLVKQVNAKGVPLNLGETVSLKMAMGGTIKSPTLKVDLKQSGETLANQMKQQVKDFVQAKIDSAKKATQDTINSLKRQLEMAAREELRKRMKGNNDTTVTKDSTPVKNSAEKTKESIKGLLDNLLKKKRKDSLQNLPKDTLTKK